MNETEVRVLKQYIDALEQASSELERMYLSKNMAGLDKVKRFINEVHGKISVLLRR